MWLYVCIYNKYQYIYIYLFIYLFICLFIYLCMYSMYISCVQIDVFWKFYCLFCFPKVPLRRRLFRGLQAQESLEFTAARLGIWVLGL